MRREGGLDVDRRGGWIELLPLNWKGSVVKSLAQAKLKRVRALELLAKGLSYDEIAGEVGYWVLIGGVRPTATWQDHPCLLWASRKTTHGTQRRSDS